MTQNQDLWFMHSKCQVTLQDQINQIKQNRMDFFKLDSAADYAVKAILSWLV